MLKLSAVRFEWVGFLSFLATVACQNENPSGAGALQTAPSAEATTRVFLLPRLENGVVQLNCTREGELPDLKIDSVYPHAALREIATSDDMVILGVYSKSDRNELVRFDPPCQVKRSDAEIFEIGSPAAGEPAPVFQSSGDAQGPTLTAKRWAMLTLDFSTFEDGTGTIKLLKDRLFDPVVQTLNSQVLSVGEQISAVRDFRARVNVGSNELCLLPPGAKLLLREKQIRHELGSIHLVHLNKAPSSETNYIQLPAGLDPELENLLQCEAAIGYVDTESFR